MIGRGLSAYLLTRDRQILKSTRVPLAGSVIDME